MKKLVLLVGDCRADYIGRASSTLGWGERVLMVKPDGSVLLHRKEGYDALNWQPPGSLLNVKLKDELSLEAVRRTPREQLLVRFRSVTLAGRFLLKDEARFEMHLTEEELYEALKKNPELVEPGFKILSMQREVGEGVSDITGRDADGNYVVVEVKREAAGEEAVKQLYKYVSRLGGKDAGVRGIIMAPKVSQGALKLLRSLGLEFKPISLRRCAELLHKRPAGELSLDLHLAEDECEE